MVWHSKAVWTVFHVSPADLEPLLYLRLSHYLLFKVLDTSSMIPAAELRKALGSLPVAGG